MAILAADLGGTRTRVVVAGVGGEVLSRAEAGPGNPVRVGTARAAESLREAASAAFSAAGRRAVAAAAVGMAGISHPSSATVVAAGLGPLGIEPPVRILVDDGAIAFRAAFAGPPGVLLMAGTGSGVRAWGEEGPFTLGGLGPDLGDEGSANAIGKRALRQCMTDAQLGDAPSDLSRRVMALVGVPEARLLAEMVRSGRLDPATVCPEVIRAADEGDDEARAHLRAAASDLYRLARVAGQRARVPAGTPLATTGSVLACSHVRDPLMELCGDDPFRPGPHVDDPVLGAVALARDALVAEGSVPPGW